MSAAARGREGFSGKVGKNKRNKILYIFTSPLSHEKKEESVSRNVQENRQKVVKEPPSDTTASGQKKADTKNKHKQTDTIGISELR